MGINDIEPDYMRLEGRWVVLHHRLEIPGRLEWDETKKEQKTHNRHDDMAVKLQYSAGMLSVSCRKPASCRQREIKMAETNKVSAGAALMFWISQTSSCSAGATPPNYCPSANSVHRRPDVLPSRLTRHKQPTMCGRLVGVFVRSPCCGVSPLSAHFALQEVTLSHWCCSFLTQTVELRNLIWHREAPAFL